MYFWILLHRSFWSELTDVVHKSNWNGCEGMYKEMEKLEGQICLPHSLYENPTQKSPKSWLGCAGEGFPEFPLFGHHTNWSSTLTVSQYLRTSSDVHSTPDHLLRYCGDQDFPSYSCKPFLFNVCISLFPIVPRWIEEHINSLADPPSYDSFVRTKWSQSPPPKNPPPIT